jgi:hypothetical protein
MGAVSRRLCSNGKNVSLRRTVSFWREVPYLILFIAFCLLGLLVTCALLFR